MRESESSPRGVRGRVLVADDATVVARLAARTLTEAGYECQVCSSAPDAICSNLERRPTDVVLADLTGETRELIRRLRASHPQAALILMTTSPNAASVISAMREGAFDYLLKPLDDEELRTIVGRAIEMDALRRENDHLRRRLSMEERVSSFVAESPTAKQLLALVRRVAAADLTVLIEGETGTGKETIARMLHYWSNRSNGPFVRFSFKGAVPAGAGPDTQTIQAPLIPFDSADGGTLFLDEITEASFAAQAELVRFLDEAGTGSGTPRPPDVRIVAGSSRPLKAEADAGRVRQDLFFRLSAIPVRIPPLRERREDILVLARRYLVEFATKAGRRLSLTSDAEREILAYKWPGNVRELRNVIERAAMLTGADFLPSKSLELGSRSDRERANHSPLEHPDGAPKARTDSVGASAGEAGGTASEANAVPPAPPIQAAPGTEAATGTLQECLDAAARVRIKAALEAAAGNRGEAAKALDIDAATLNRLIRRLGL